MLVNILYNNFIGDNKTITEFYMIQSIIYSFEIFANFVLTYYAIFNPNDFVVKGKGIKQPFPIDRPNNEIIENSVGILMTGYKRKEQIIYYDIIVSINGLTHKVSHTYPEFDDLHNAIIHACNTEGLPPIKTPEFPNFRMKKITLEEKTAALGEYLKNICNEKLFISDLLDFLNIQGKIRESILKYTQKIHETVRTESIHRSESAIISYFNTESKSCINENLTLSVPAYHLN